MKKIETLPSFDDLEREYERELFNSQFASKLSCSKCGTEMFYVAILRVAKKRRSRFGHRKRIVARCSKCSDIVRVAYGGYR